MVISRSTRRLVASLLAIAATSCGGDRRAPETRPVEVRVTDVAGAAVAGARIVAGTREVAVTTKDGAASLEVPADVGDWLALTVRCPEGYASPSEPLLVRPPPPDAGVPSHLAHCRRLRHSLLVAIRAEGGPNLPILRFGRAVGRTDGDGAATLAFDVAPDDRVELTISTEPLADPKITPRDPTQVFTAAERDGVAVFEVKLTRPKPPKRRAVPRRGPVPM